VSAVVGLGLLGVVVSWWNSDPAAMTWIDEHLPWPLGFAAVLGGGFAAFAVAVSLGMLVGMVLASVGAYLVDPDGIRDFGPLAEKPRASTVWGIRRGMRLLSKRGRGRLRSELDAAWSEKEAEWEKWQTDMANIASFRVQNRERQTDVHQFSTLEEAQAFAKAEVEWNYRITGIDADGGTVRDYGFLDRSPSKPVRRDD
jgi:hypothetical protein